MYLFIALNPFDLECILLVEYLHHGSHRQMFILNYNSLRNCAFLEILSDLKGCASTSFCCAHIYEYTHIYS